MNYDRILIRYGEISTKGRNRHQFVERLRRSIKDALQSYPMVKIEAGRDRMFILLNGENSTEIIKILQKIFGIRSFSPAVKVERDIEKIKQAADELFRNLYHSKQTFKISAKRADRTFEYNTDDINQILGAHILKSFPELKVDVRNPVVNLEVEIRAEAAYLSAETILGPGGLPVGSSGKAMLMLSGGLDSPVAGYMAMKRGMELEVVHFFSPPYTSERAKQKVIDLTKKLSEIAGTLTLHIVPFTKAQEAVSKQIPENYVMTTTRRLMLRITDELRRKHEALAIITGESLGQVASQTLESMYAINEVTTTPILRPLIMMDKTDIIKIAQEINTHDISIRPFEDCCTIFVPASPKTKPRREKVNFYESFMDFEVYIQEAVNNSETMIIKPDSSTEASFNELF
ncbi:tRNA uracil 4-sulfurtransferase ThiI [Neobacillus sp. PS3-12]|jgi:tRNA uracil 4-sulfurtransferase|uniref:tRNA uracil 4-sulfurtransferase ThiI n=1 Tax=Neobacillus sp. PS3-12 TaxID=3070677 RepID=UPI0027DF5649|nr:tRNA uracil 4-sulfurtransferase ThiI [Neobacillus sp. PS3-12]WML54312.1 tRNA uracil 4-sulfurtransferase ThiI [Neobacillus sp. PS3-12]